MVTKMTVFALQCRVPVCSLRRPDPRVSQYCESAEDAQLGTTVAIVEGPGKTVDYSQCATAGLR